MMAIASYLGVRLSLASALYELIVAGLTIWFIISVMSGVLSLTSVIVAIIRNRVAAMTRAEAISF
jgi:glycerol-3-phosphate acyltransferase PlsY